MLWIRLCTAEVRGSNPLGSTHEVPAKRRKTRSPRHTIRGLLHQFLHQRANSAKNSATRGRSRAWQNGLAYYVRDTLVCQKRQESDASSFPLRRANTARSTDDAPRVVTAALDRGRASRLLPPICLAAPRLTGGGSLLLPVRDAAISLAHPAHATVLRDHDRHRSGQRTGQPIGRAVASTHVCSPLFDDLLAF
jgi:hypothetical protein